MTSVIRRPALPLALLLLLASCSKEDGPGQGGADSGVPGTLDDGGAGNPDANVVTSDVDGDGLDDAWEVRNGLDPARNDADEDPDGDGLTNLREFQLTTLPKDLDTDDDGVADGEEDLNHSGTRDPGETSATALDSDGDGLTDGQELGRTAPLTTNRPGIEATNPAVFVPDLEPVNQTNPNAADTDGDGLPDGLEDADHNGRVDSSETDGLDLDSDDDGLGDGAEDVNKDGRVDPNETDPRNADTDRDGLPDGLEAGVTTPVPDPDGNGPLRGTNVNVFRPDLDPATHTNPTGRDTDGDGVIDGDEDWNHNGRVDPGELDPNKADTDGDGTPDGEEGQAVVCSTAGLRPVVLHSLASADVTLALPPEYAEVTILREGSGRGVGISFRNTTSGVVGFVISKTPQGGDVNAEKQGNRNRLDQAANLSNEQDRQLISWDGFPAVFTTANAAGGRSAEEIATDMATRVAQAGALTGGLAAGAAAASYTVYFETILRQGRAIVLGALAPDPASEANLIALSDMANGTGVAQFGDFTGLGCDAFTSPPGNDVVDLLWIVDNSCSMSEEQANVAAAGNEMVALLSTTQLSWRLALTTTEQVSGSIDCCGVNGFTPSQPRATAEAQSRQWASAVGSLGTGGSGMEQGLTFGLTAIAGALPATANEDPLKFRQGASVIVVHMSDEEDFSVKTAAGGNDSTCPENAGKQRRVDELIAGYRAAAMNAAGIAGLTTFAIHGISPNTTVDPCTFSGGSSDCNTSQHGRAYVDVAAAMGGGNGSICGNMGQVVQDIIRAGAGIASQIELTRPPISSTIRVVMADESGRFVGQPDVPRSRSNGFDYSFALDLMTNRVQHKIVFYGSARPPANRELMISYRTWEDGSPNPAGPDCQCGPGQRCNGDDNACEIDPTCGMCPGSQVCNPNTGLCESPDDCEGMCEAGTTCIDGMCVPDDPCMGLCQPGQICDTSTNPPTCRGL